MTVYEAIEDMRRKSKNKEFFSFTFMSYNSSKNHSDGIVSVRNARLRKRPVKADNKNHEYQLSYFDFDEMQPKQFWIPLLMAYNGQKVDLV